MAEYWIARSLAKFQVLPTVYIYIYIYIYIYMYVYIMVRNLKDKRLKKASEFVTSVCEMCS